MGDIAYYYKEQGGSELILSHGQARTYPWHMHTQHWTVGLVRCGHAVLATGKGEQELGQGQSFFVRPYEPHSLRIATESALAVLCIDRQGSVALEGNWALALPELCCLQPQVKAWFEKALAGIKEHQPLDAHGQRLPEGHDSPMVSSVLDLMRRMQEAPEDTWHIDQMAAHAGYSPWHFLRAFQKVLGMTPHAFQLLCRLRLLRSMLRADTAACTAAVSAGFADQSHMHKAFKRHHGLTPREFKKASIKLGL